MSLKFDFNQTSSREPNQFLRYAFAPSSAAQMVLQSANSKRKSGWRAVSQVSSVDGGVGSAFSENDSSSEENFANAARLQRMRAEFTSELIRALAHHPVIPGEVGPADQILRRCIEQNSAVAMQWIQDLFLSNFKNPAIACDLLLLVGRLSREDAYPGGQTMALGGLSHASGAVQEAAIRAYETWGGVESLDVLRSVSERPAWLQDYIAEVIADIEAAEGR